MESDMITGGHALVRALAAHGVTDAFGIPGTHNLEIYRHLTLYGIRHVTPRHEQGAGYAADGYARVTGSPGVVITTTGPAVLNAAAAVGQSYSDSIPVLLISPGMPLAHPALPNGLLHETKSQTRALDAICAYSHRVSSLPEIEVAVARAFSSFAAARRRPVHLEIPLDLLLQTAVFAPSPPTAPGTSAPRPAAELIRAAAHRLHTARRTLIVAGGGSRGADVTKLAEALHAPVVTTANGKGVVDETHPLSLGVALHLPTVQRMLRDAGVVLAIGTELAESDFWCDPPTLRTIIRVDIDPTQTIGALIALPGDAAQITGELLAALPDAKIPDWDMPGLRAERDAQAHHLGARWLPWLSVLRQALAPDAIITSDQAMACYRGALANLPVPPSGWYLHPTGFATLGYALPAAIGAAVAAGPERQVVALCGDGGLQFSIAELGTAAELGRPLPVVVFDNAGFGEIRAQEREHGIAPIAVDIATPDLPAIARAYGGAGVQVGEPAQLGTELAAALDRPGPTVIVVPEQAR